MAAWRESWLTAIGGIQPVTAQRNFIHDLEGAVLMTLGLNFMNKLGESKDEFTEM
jgi:hypothetical protein